MQKVKNIFTHRNIGQLAGQIALDVIMINAAMIFALCLRYDFDISNAEAWRLGNLWPVMTLICLISFALNRLYQGLWQYAGIQEGFQILLGTALGMGATFLFCVISDFIIPGEKVFLFGSKTVYPIAWFALLMLTAAQRFSARMARMLKARARVPEKSSQPRVMIVGAGWAGSTLIREYSASAFRTGLPVVVVDDDVKKSGAHIGRYPVVIGTDRIPEYAQQYRVDEIVIAIPSASPEKLRLIMEACTRTSCKLKLVPGMRDVTNGQLQLGKMRDVNITDLLYREEVKLDMDSISEYLTDRVVLVTGGGGSIGSELCRQIASFKPRRLVVFDIYENNAYDLCNELKEKYGSDFPIDLRIGSVRDEARVRDIFEAYKPSVVFHAAAHKHVPIMECNPAEAVKNNVFGTLNVAHLADRYGVERFVLLSTDKAVNPLNVMGATKRITEMIIQTVARHSKTRFMAVRFGNVLGSNGSVVPIFMRQIANGGPVTVMHPDITRYFMTIPEASRLVLQAGALGESGTIYVLDMGTPVKIMDLARNIIRLSGYRPDEDIKIEITGLRPGDKLYEELMMASEQETMTRTMHEKIFIIHPSAPDEARFRAQLNELQTIALNHPELVREKLRAIVPTYVSDRESQVG